MPPAGRRTPPADCHTPHAAARFQPRARRTPPTDFRTPHAARSLPILRLTTPPAARREPHHALEPEWPTVNPFFARFPRASARAILSDMDAARELVAYSGRKVELIHCTPPDADALADWSDMHLGRDYFFRAGHIKKVIERQHNTVLAVEVDEVMAGFLILYKGSVLHNLYLQPEYRQTGIGSAILQHVKPMRIRSKTNMLAGDPTPFYAKNGYVADCRDPDRPHIIDMVLPELATRQPPVETEPGKELLEPAALEGSKPAADGIPAHFGHFTSCDGWAVAGGSQASVAPGFTVPVAPATPIVAALPADEREELDRLRKREKNQKRAKEYRARVKQQIASGLRKIEHNGTHINA